MIWAAIIINGVLRRIDGMSKEDWPSWLSFVSAVSTRAIPVVLSAYLLSLVWAPESLFLYICHVAFGGAISGSLQRGYDGWEDFSFRQITQHAIAGVAYIALCPVSPVLSLVGVAFCLLAGLTHPALCSMGVANYTKYAEFLTGVMLLAPFAFVA